MERSIKEEEGREA